MAELINVTADIKAATAHLTRLQKQQIPFAVSVAVNTLAKLGQGAMHTAMQRAFDRPKPYTLGGTFVARGNKRNPTATVGLIDKPKGAGRAPGKYLSPQIGGGNRPMAGYEVALRAIGALPNGYRAVPSERLKLDRYGNIQRKDLAEIIGALKTGLRVAAGRGKRAHLRGYFVALPGQRNTAHLHPGIWLRVERAAPTNSKRKNSGKATSAVQPVLMFVQRTTYKQRLDVRAAVETSVRQNARAEMDKALEYAMSTAR